MVRKQSPVLSHGYIFQEPNKGVDTFGILVTGGSELVIKIPA